MGPLIDLSTQAKRSGSDDPHGILRRSHRIQNGKQRAPTLINSLVALQDFRCIIDRASDHQGCNKSAALVIFCFKVAHLSSNESPHGNEQVGGIDGLGISVGTIWGHRDVNSLATLVD